MCSHNPGANEFLRYDGFDLTLVVQEILNFRGHVVCSGRGYRAFGEVLAVSCQSGRGPVTCPVY
jgi:hypothetical protein